MSDPPRREGRTGVERYIALEGIEGAGKTSVQAALSDRFTSSGDEVLCVREPGGTRLGSQLRRILLYGDELDPWTEALMFATDRAHLASNVIRPALENGAWVISDRSVYSSLAYQGVGRGLGLKAIRLVNEAGLSGVWPGLVVLLRVDVEKADSMGIQGSLFGDQPSSQSAQMTMDLEGTDRIGLRGVDFQVHVSAAFDLLASQDPDRFVVIDASQPFDLVVDEAWDAVQA